MQKNKMEVHELDAYIAREYQWKLQFTTQGCELINLAQELITSLRVDAKEREEIVIPRVNLYMINGNTINGASLKIEGEYYIFIRLGVIDNQKKWLENNLNFDNVSDKNVYVTKLIEYGWFFMVFHEYAHIICGHTDACLEENSDKQAQECEADMFSVEYLICYIITKFGLTSIGELENLYIAIYFLLANMQSERWEKHYNDSLIQNYYDPDYITKRDHPLSAQRMIYLFSMFNVFLIDKNIVNLPIKDNILNRLMELKNVKNKLRDVRENEDFEIVQNSIRELQKELRTIRRKIPRI